MSHSYLEKLVSTNYKWKVLKRKKPPKWWLISSYKNVLQVWSGGLSPDAEVGEDVFENGGRGEGFLACDLAEGVEAEPQVFTQQVAAQSAVEPHDDPAQMGFCLT